MREEVKEELDREILWLFENRIVRDFPIQPLAIITRMTDCRYITYRQLAAASGRTVADIIQACSSADGCTHYDQKKGRYLIAVNTEGINRARIRWTTTHELGHILAGHFTELAEDGRQEASPSELEYMEEEADYFAASLLAPLAAIRKMRAKSPADIRLWFDISQTAAEYRWRECRYTDGPTPMDDYYSWASARSSVRTGRLKRERAVDIWPDKSDAWYT